MKKLINVILVVGMVFSLFGCSSATFEEKIIYNTDLVGTYSLSLNGSTLDSDEIIYTLEEKYIFSDKGVDFTFYEKIDSQERNNSYTGTYTTNQINNDILAIEIKHDGQTYERYKYKNMLGYYYESEIIPSTKSFDLSIPQPNEVNPNAALVFTEDGYTHSCADITNCHQCVIEKDNKYQLKDDIIYLQNVNSEGDYWQIYYYVVDGGLFEPEVYKVEE